MRIVTLLARHGTATYGDAVVAMDGVLARQMPDVARDLLVIDTALAESHHESLGAGRTLIGAPNTHWEFSAWDRGLSWLGERIDAYDFIHLATSAFRMFTPRHLDRFDAGMLELVRGRAAAVGHIDYFDEPVTIGHRSLQSWLRSSFIVVPPAELRRLGSLVSIDDPRPYFSGDPQAPFRADAPLSARYRDYITGWLTGPGTGQGVEWHSRFELTPATLSLFAAKAMAILNEQVLSARLRAQDCDLVDATWLATQRARLAAGAPLGDIPEWRWQITQRDVDAAPRRLIEDIDVIAPRSRPVSPRPKAPDAAAWDELARAARAPHASPVVDVIVPVYRGHDDTLACLHSVLAGRNTTAYELVVIDDASPEPDLAAALDAIAARGLIDLVRNETNQGFVRSVNAGMARHPDRDAILLNSDTIVHDGWIDRLRAHRLGKGRIGTITPWSNNATLLSYPVPFERNNFDLEIDFAALDRLAAAELAGEDCDMPTGVGFCLYVSRDCLDDVGLFNAEAFGRGYGEENDFCRRAAARGWRNIAACDVFVRHTGEVSFQADAAEAQRRAAAALLALHPHYIELIAAFMRADPLRPYRERLDLARLRRWGGGRLVLRFGDDGSGDGDAPLEDAARIVRVRPSPDDANALVMTPVADLVLPNLPRLPIADVEAAVRLLFGVGVVGARMGTIPGLTADQASFAREAAAKLRPQPA